MKKIVVFGINSDGKEFVRMHRAANFMSLNKIVAIIDNDSRNILVLFRFLSGKDKAVSLYQPIKEVV